MCLQTTSSIRYICNVVVKSLKQLIAIENKSIGMILNFNLLKRLLETIYKIHGKFKM